MKTTIPPKLYKYQSYNIQTIDNFKNRSLWFSKPSRFNDPFDSSIPYVLENMSEDEWNILYKQVKKIWEDTKDEVYKKSVARYFLDDKPNEDFKKDYNSVSKSGWLKQVKDTFSQQGIACFSENVDNILMWSHYSDGHRGFCLEFDTSFYPFSKAIQVHYSEFLPSLHPADDEILLAPLLTTKSIGWSYEKEWRVIHAQGDIECGFDSGALTGVYFGSEMPFVHIETLSLAVSGSPTKLYKMKRSKTEFKVEFDEVTYTPYEYGKTNRRFLS